MRLLMVAPPGAGKGTQAELLSARFGIEHIASGELLRSEIRRGTDIGRQARRFVEAGDLVPDELVLAMIVRRLVAAAAAGGYVLDGFPRNRAQAEAADRELDDEDASLQAVIALEVSHAELRRRMLARGVTDGRSDDQRITIDHRLEVYDLQTKPLLAYYEERGLLRTVDGEQPVADVFAAIVDALSDVTSRP